MKMAQQTTGELDQLDGRKVTATIETINRQINTSEYRGSVDGGAYLRARSLGRRRGGRVYGPGSTTSDSIPHMLSKDEYVLKAAAGAEDRLRQP